MRVPFLLLLLLLVPDSVAAQTVRGRVYEYGTQTMISGATIEVTGSKGERTATTSDSTGYFILFPASAGTVTVEVSHHSYVADSTLVVTVRPKETITLVVRMTRQAIPITPIVVTARSASALGGFHERQRRSQLGQFIDQEEIERRKPVTFTHLLRGMHGVEVEDAMGSEQVMMRSRGPEWGGYGLGRCPAAIFVDGMPMPAGFDLESVLPLPRVAAVEIYPDVTGLPFEFTTIGGECGVVAFWSRPVQDARPITWKRAGLAGLIIGAIIVIQRAIVNGSQSDISDRAMPDFSFAPVQVAPPSASAPTPGGNG